MIVAGKERSIPRMKPLTYLSSERRFGVHITPDLDGVIVAVIDTAGHPLDAGPLAALDRAEVQRLRDDLAAWCVADRGRAA